MSLISSLKSRLQTPEIKYILLMFFSTRIILSIIGVLARKNFSGHNVTQPGWANNIWLDIWGVWDTGWYMNIAQNGYAIESLEQVITEQTSIAFFPLYPLLMKLLGSVIGSPYIAGLIISNLFLVISCVYLYRLVRLDSDENSALKSVKYLLLFPVSFILSGVFTEATYLALTLMCFYYARTGRWKLAGISGLFLSATRSVGVLIILPLLYEGFMPLLKENKDLKSLKNYKELKNSKDRILPLFYLALIPLGLVSFMVYNYHLTGDFMAFAHCQVTWGRQLSNPLDTLINGYHANINTNFEAIFATVVILIFLFFYRRIRFSYWLFGIYSLFIPLSTGIQSMPRFILVIFPLYILFADITKNRFSEDLVMIFFALLQGCLMVFWTNSSFLVV